MVGVGVEIVRGSSLHSRAGRFVLRDNGFPMTSPHLVKDSRDGLLRIYGERTEGEED